MTNPQLGDLRVSILGYWYQKCDYLGMFQDLISTQTSQSTMMKKRETLSLNLRSTVFMRGEKRANGY